MSILVIVCSLPTINAADEIINDLQGINQGIANTGDGNTLFLSSGTYNKVSDLEITINKNLTIQGKGPVDTVIIDGLNSKRMFTIGSDNLNVTFINITFINASATSLKGSVIINSYKNTNLTIINCSFINNSYIDYAKNGAIINNNGNNMFVSSCNFINNSLISENGGVIYNNGTNVTVTNCNFTNNTAVGTVFSCSITNIGNMTVISCNFDDNGPQELENFVLGGVILNFNFYDIVASLTVINCNFTNNQRCYSIFSEGKMSVTDSNFTNNFAGILNQYDNTTVINCNFINNTNSKILNGNSGSAIFNMGSNMFVSGCNFTNNSANNELISGSGYGGAISNLGDDFIVISCNFINNTANGGSGGGMYNTGLNVTVKDCNFTNNHAYGSGKFVTTHGHGGGIFNVGNITVRDCNFTNNTAEQCGGGISNNIHQLIIISIGSMILSNNVMEGNTAGVLAHVIYNNGTMGVLNLTYLGNATVKVDTNTIIILNATLTDDMGNPITGQNVNFYVDEILIGSAFVNEGEINVNFNTDYNIGTLVVNGTYEGIGIHDIAMKQGTLLYQNNTNTTFIVTETWKYGQFVTISGVVTDEFGNLAENITFNVIVDGNDYLVTTENNGQWFLAYKTNKTGAIDIVAIFSGDEYFYGFTNNTSFNVDKSNSNSTIITPNNPIIREKTIISGVLTDENDNTLSNTEIVLTVNGQTHTTTTDSHGKWILNYVPNSIGNFNVIVSWEGNETYNGFINHVNFTVNEIKSLIEDENPITPEKLPESENSITKNNSENSITKNNSKNTSNHPGVNVSLKETGLPIIAILFVLICLVGIISRKQ
jgi:hypothetical protein